MDDLHLRCVFVCVCVLVSAWEIAWVAFGWQYSNMHAIITNHKSYSSLLWWTVFVRVYMNMNEMRLYLVCELRAYGTYRYMYTFACSVHVHLSVFRTFLRLFIAWVVLISVSTKVNLIYLTRQWIVVAPCQNAPKNPLSKAIFLSVSSISVSGKVCKHKHLPLPHNVTWA